MLGLPEQPRVLPVGELVHQRRGATSAGCGLAEGSDRGGVRSVQHHVGRGEGLEGQLAEELDLAEVRRRIQAQQEASREAEAEVVARRYAHIRPLDGNAYVDQVQNTDRFYLGIPEVDRLTRGHGRGEFTLVTGREGSGKTQVVLNALNNNPDAYAIIFTPDESPEMVLSKLISIRYGVSAEALEQRVKANDDEAVSLVRSAAAEDFKHLIVIDGGLSLVQMGEAVDEAQDYWGAHIDMVVYDYLELLEGSDYGAVTRAAQGLKRWARPVNAPVFCIHQGKRGEGNTRGTEQGMDGMRYGGAAEAIIVLEVYRKKDNQRLNEHERSGHQNSITLSIAKNKRPPGKVGSVDLFIDPNTGHIRKLTPEDLFRAGKPTTDAAVMLRS